MVTELLQDQEEETIKKVEVEPLAPPVPVAPKAVHDSIHASKQAAKIKEEEEVKAKRNSEPPIPTTSPLIESLGGLILQENMSDSHLFSGIGLETG